MGLGFFKQDIGIDLGTANTLVYIKGKGIVLDEASVIAYNKNTKTIIAVGNDAKNMIGAAPPHISVVKPLQDGVISDFGMTSMMLKTFISRGDSHFFLFYIGARGNRCAFRRHGG